VASLVSYGQPNDTGRDGCESRQCPLVHPLPASVLAVWPL